MEITIPEDMNPEDVQKFLSFLSSHPDTSTPKVKITQNCYNCEFGPNCNLSLNCRNEVFEHKIPSRWLMKRR